MTTYHLTPSPRQDGTKQVDGWSAVAVVDGVALKTHWAETSVSAHAAALREVAERETKPCQ